MSFQHHHHHCQRSQNQDGKWICKLPGCAGRVHASKEALESHVNLSHMSRLSISCPIRGCEHSGMRVAQLPAHIHSSHSELLGTEIVHPSNSILLKPGHSPFPPHLEVPPSLPSGEHSLLEINPHLVRCSPYRRRSVRTPQSVGRKWSRLDAQDDEDREPEAADLDDLPKFDHSEEAKKKTHIIICRRKPPEPAKSPLSQAHRMVNSPPLDEEPPISIHFDTFARKVDELVAKGLI